MSTCTSLQLRDAAADERLSAGVPQGTGVRPVIFRPVLPPRYTVQRRALHGRPPCYRPHLLLPSATSPSATPRFIPT
ncbi:hypothetical protein J6590_033394 [Homalodisca vitripennis]|nr:hypothetical protein J6590_033394 [Homalodisca vitripennis]